MSNHVARRRLAVLNWQRHVGLPFAFAHILHLTLSRGRKVYRDVFQPSEVFAKARISCLSVPVIAASTDSAAQLLFLAPQHRFLRLIRG